MHDTFLLYVCKRFYNIVTVSKKIALNLASFSSLKTIKNIRNIVTLVVSPQESCNSHAPAAFNFARFALLTPNFEFTFYSLSKWLRYEFVSHDQRNHACILRTRINIIISCLRGNIEILASVLLTAFPFPLSPLPFLVPFDKSYASFQRCALGSIWTPLWGFFVRTIDEKCMHFGIFMYVER